MFAFAAVFNGDVDDDDVDGGNKFDDTVVVVVVPTATVVVDDDVELTLLDATFGEEGGTGDEDDDEIGSKVFAARLDDFAGDGFLCGEVEEARAVLAALAAPAAGKRDEGEEDGLSNTESNGTGDDKEEDGEEGMAPFTAGSLLEVGFP